MIMITETTTETTTEIDARAERVGTMRMAIASFGEEADLHEIWCEVASRQDEESGREHSADFRAEADEAKGFIDEVPDEADEDFLDRLAEAVESAASEWTGADWTVEGLPLDGERAADWVPAAQAVQVAGRLGDLPRQIGGISRRTLLLHAMEEEDDAADPPPGGSTLGEWSQAARDAWGPGGPSRLLHAAIDLITRSADWLTSVEADASAAAVEGRAALAAAQKGELEQALQHAESACYIERQYGDCPCWRPVRALIRERIRAQD